MYWNLTIVFPDIRDIVPMSHLPIYLPPYTRLLLQRQWSLHVDCFCSYYSTVLNNTDIFISNKGKTLISTNSVEVYTKEQLATEIQRFTIANIQPMTDKIETEKTKVNLEIDKIRLLKKKNSLIVKKKEASNWNRYNEYCWTFQHLSSQSLKPIVKTNTR